MALAEVVGNNEDTTDMWGNVITEFRIWASLQNDPNFSSTLPMLHLML